MFDISAVNKHDKFVSADPKQNLVLSLFMEKIVKTESKLQVKQKWSIYLDIWFSKASA